jgi:hypothetical protein
MLSGAQLTIAIAAVLVAAIVLGWFLHWLWTRLSHAALSETARRADMMNRLHEADRAREIAEEARELAENLLAAREGEMENRMTAMQARLDGAVEGREAQLAAQLREARADGEASMAGLRNARARIMELEAEVERLREAAGEG